MIKKSNLKIILILVVFLSALMLINTNVLRILFGLPKTDDFVDNSNSRLLNMLVEKSVFSEEWKWKLIDTFQQDEPNSSLNIHEIASRKFVGYYKKHNIRFIHTLSIYEDLTIEFDNEPELQSYGVEIIDQVFLSTFQSLTFSPPVCYFGIDRTGAKVTRCVLVRVRDNIGERIDLDILNDISIESALSILQNVSMYFDNMSNTIQ